jgi:predicted DCC family thiol-disulfide oxidoreductase YuxK
MNLIFFDGVCGLCNRFVNLLIDADKNHALKFAPLQGKTAAELLPKEFIQELKTIVYCRNQQIYTESDAVLEILKSIGGIWAIFYIFKWIPKLIRDYIYQWISLHRLHWFGRLDSCRMPSKEERARFLD